MTYAALERWSGAVAALLTDVDSTSLPQSLMEALAAGVPFDGTFIAVFHQDAPPTVIHQSGPPEPSRRYAEGPYLLDPYFNRYRSEPSGGCFRLRELAPEGFTQTDYFTSYYRHLGVRDEIGYILPLDAASAAHVSASRTLRFPGFLHRELAWFKAVAPVVHAVAQRIWQRESQRPFARSRERSALHDALSRAVEQFGTSILTDREIDVARLLLKGNSAKAIARSLGISPGTARNHLKKIYSKLGVTSQAEIFALFFRALEMADAELTSDPLLRLGTVHGRASQ